jgi:DNA-binding XRE family transcriptional regulator
MDPVARPYEDVVGSRRRATDENLARFAVAAETDLQDVYDQIFGLGEIVAACRAELHLSQDQLVQAAGIPQADISRIERGKGNPTLATMTKLLGALQFKLGVQPSH